jgi:tetratricopeptide (TPR) repeat protein
MKALILVAVLAGVAVAAPDAAQMQKAKVHFKQGKELYDKGDWRGAIAEYEAAYKFAPLAELVFNIAKAQQKGGDIEAALASYQRYIDLDPTGRGSLEARKQVDTLKAQVDARRAAADKAAADKAAADKAAADQAAAEEAARVAALTKPAPAPKTPSTKRPWFWAVVGVGAAVVVAGVAAGAAVGASPKDPVPTYGAIRW